jgi:hypothetical protein
MLLEVAKPIALGLCVVSLYAVFCAAFLDPASDVEQRIWNSLDILAVAAGISFLGGMIFREAAEEAGGGPTHLAATLPVRLFLWTVGAMAVLFVAAWYLASHFVLYRDVRRL